MTDRNDPFAPIETRRSLCTLVVCPRCTAPVDVTVETHRARIDTISLLWDAFWQKGTQVELDLEQLRNELEVEVLRRVRGTPPLAQFCEITFKEHEGSEASISSKGAGREPRGP